MDISEAKKILGEKISFSAVDTNHVSDHDPSAYVDQWDWERVITPEEPTIDFLKDIVTRI